LQLRLEVPIVKRRQFLESIAASTAALALPHELHAGLEAVAPAEAAGAGASQNTSLWYRAPAEKWIEALPLGNGRVGAMVFGKTAGERIQLNEETVWSGGPYDPTNPKGPDALPEIRRLVFAGEDVKAHRLFGRSMFGLAIPQMQYQPMGDLWLTFPKQSQPADKARQLATDFALISPRPVTDYERRLDLDTAIVSVRYRIDGTLFTREVFISPVDQVMVVRLTADRPGQITFTAALTVGNQEQQDGDARYDAVAPNELVSRGRAMSDEGIDGKVWFVNQARVITEGGTISLREGELSVVGANAATVLVAARTSYIDYQKADRDPAPMVVSDIQKAAEKSYEQLRLDHIAEHQRLFKRVSLDLGSSKFSGLPTDERLKRFPKTNDPGVPALYFQFGRYLMISSSRSGCRLPANLQGIWNESPTPPWGSKYTTNINLQMNYWPAEVANLSDCADSLFQLIADLVEPGAHVAKVNYGAEGWVLHQNTDLWLACAPMDGPTWGTFATAGAWLCTHLWEHCLFNGSQEDLQKFYPLMKGSAQFFLSTLVEHPTHKWMVTCPSMSPEHYPTSLSEDEVTNLHLKGTTICAGPTMDMSILRSLFDACIEGSERLGIDADFRGRLKETRSRLAPFQIGKYGQLQEWIEDWDEPTDHHRHLSPLWGLYPGHEITPLHTPKLAAAATKLLEFRGERGPGWTMAWKICLRARLFDGEIAASTLAALLTAMDEDNISYKDGGTYLNLMNAEPFQLDANMGATAGIGEMLLQSHAGDIHFLPAIPAVWANGAVEGLKARGGFVVDMKWKNSKVTTATIHSGLGRVCRIRSAAPISQVSSATTTVSFTRPEENVVEFQTTAGEGYTITPAS
jgi:alpha-L-fucosidase 2